MMQLFNSFSTYAAIVAMLSLHATTTAAPTSDETSVNLVARQKIPKHINIGINKKRYNAQGKGMWTAWVNGDDPCNHHTDLGVYEDEASPCNIRFALDGQDYQYSMQGCGGDLWLMRNGKENVGSCYWAPGDVGCVAGDGYGGRWQCAVNDA